MSVSPAFAGNTQGNMGGNSKKRTQSKTKDKKPSAEKFERKVPFCTWSRVGHVVSNHNQGIDKSCVLPLITDNYLKNIEYSTNNVKCGYLSDREQKFPVCKICGSHDVKLIFNSHGYTTWCYGKCHSITDRACYSALPVQSPASAISYSTAPVFNVSKSAIKFSDEYDGFITGLDCKEDLKFFEGVRFAEFTSSVSENSEDCIYYLDTTIEDKPRVVKRFSTPQDEYSLD